MSLGLEIYTIYNNPSDFPGEFVARKSEVFRGGTINGEIISKGKTLEEVRKGIPPGLYRLERQIHDDPVIVEVWI